MSLKNEVLVKGSVLLAFFFSFSFMLPAQSYDIVITGGHVVDPRNNIDEVMDVAIRDGSIALVAAAIDTAGARQVVEAHGLYVVPGLIDIHTHHFWGSNLDQAYMDGPNAFPPDGFTFRNGVTTIVDAGSPGWSSFEKYKRQTIDLSKTRVLAFLNIVGQGMRGSVYEQNTSDMDSRMAALMAKRYKDHVVGFKVAHFEGADWTPIDRAVQAGELAGGIPVMVDFGGSTPPLPIKELFLNHLRPGDIFTHCFAQLNSREFLVDLERREIKPFVYEARDRGIVFDVGYGGISFAYSQAIPAIKAGFYPNTLSTDLHIGSMNAAMKDLLTVMDKFIAMGMDFNAVIKAVTWEPARVIKREELGHLSVGVPADVAVLGIRKGDFGFFDYTGHREAGDKRLECEVTIRNGEVVYDLNGKASPVYYKRR